MLRSRAARWSVNRRVPSASGGPAPVVRTPLHRSRLTPVRQVFGESRKKTNAQPTPHHPRRFGFCPHFGQSSDVFLFTNLPKIMNYNSKCLVCKFQCWSWFSRISRFDKFWLSDFCSVALFFDSGNSLSFVLSDFE